MTRIARELELDWPCGTLLFSSEGLTHHLFDFDADALAAFRAMTRNLRLTVFLVVRDYDAWAKSYYKQVILNPVLADPNHAEQLYGTALAFSEFKDLPIVRRYRDHHGLLDALKRSFAPERLIVAAYEYDWFRSFRQLLGLPDEVDPGAARHNTGIPDWLAEIVRQLNALRLGEIERQALLGLIGTLPSVRGTNLPAACGATGRPAQADAVERFLAALRPGGWCDAARLQDFRDRFRQASIAAAHQ